MNENITVVCRWAGSFVGLPLQGKILVVGDSTLNCTFTEDKWASKFIGGIFGGIGDCSNLET